MSGAIKKTGLKLNLFFYFKIIIFIFSLYFSPSSEETSNLAQQKDDPIERAILMKIHLEVVGMGVDAEFFCGMDVCCFEISKRGSTVDKVYEYPEKTGENVKVI